MSSVADPGRSIPLGDGLAPVSAERERPRGRASVREELAWSYGLLALGALEIAALVWLMARPLPPAWRHADNVVPWFSHGVWLRHPWLRLGCAAGVAWWWGNAEIRAATDTGGQGSTVVNRGPEAWVLGVHGVCVALAFFWWWAGQEVPPDEAWIAVWVTLLLGALVALVVSYVLRSLPVARASRLLHATALPAIAGFAVGDVLGELSGPAAGWLHGHLQGPTLALVHGVLRAVGASVVYDPAVHLVGTAAYAVRVGVPCAGHVGVGALLAVVATYMTIERHALRWPRALGLLGAAAAVMWLTDALRISILIGVGTFWSPQLATDGFHSNLGWLFLLAVAALTLRVSRTRWFLLEPTPTAHTIRSPLVAFLAPLLVLLLSRLAPGLFDTGFDALYPLRIVAAGAALWVYRGNYRTEWTRPAWIPVGLGVLVYGTWIALEPVSEADGLPGPPRISARDRPGSLDRLPRVWFSAHRSHR